MNKKLSLALLATLLGTFSIPADACTGITLKSQDGQTIVARTIEWGGSDLQSQYVIVPRGYRQQSFLPGGATDGMSFTARHGYVGLSVEQEQFVAEGLNEVGLSAGLFYFPAYGQYEAYDPAEKATTLADLQLVAYVLGECATVDEVKAAVQRIHIVQIDPRASTVHWRFTDLSGRQIVLEIVEGGQLRFYENPLGVLTNSPDFPWHLTNLNNYVNLFPGPAPAQKLGNVELKQFGAGSGFLGLPGDVTPPSRFVRATFYQATAPQQATAEKAVQQGFQILNNFDIPVGIEFADGKIPANIPSATQWTSATDMQGRRIYFRTMYDSRIRCIDLNSIDFNRTEYQARPMDTKKEQPIQHINIQ